MTSAQDDEEPPLAPDALQSPPPPLTTEILTSAPDKLAALNLVADSIAQQYRLAAKAIIFHPVIIAIYIVTMAITSQFLYSSGEDIPKIATTCAVITGILLVGVQIWAREYLTLAEKFNTSFLSNDDSRQDIILGSRHGERIIGALILRIERVGGGGHGNRKKKKPKGDKPRDKGLIRAWTTREKYRDAGIGTELLEEAVRLTRKRLGNAAEIGFATEHANSRMVLPEMFNQSFRMQEMRAIRSLDAVVKRMTRAGKKRR